mgnify:CR=1 FL=1
MNKLLIICGPTATGKTALAVQIAKKFDGELVSADSRQVYIGMDIGTGKDRAKIDVPVWLLDIVNPDEEFSVSVWVKLAGQAVADILSRNKLPIVVGGTGLYIHALIHRPETMDIPPDKKLREKLQNASVGVLQHMIEPTILQSMNQSDRQNPRRLIRKIEIARAKKTLRKSKKIFDCLSVGLTAPQSDLYTRIDDRVDERLRQGMKEEVETLIKKFGRNFPSMSALGYRSLEHWKKDEHSYARRQRTWFKKQKSIEWFDVTGPGYPENVTRSILAWYTRVSDEHKD